SAAARHVLQAAFARGHQGHFAEGEKTVDDRQQDDEQEFDDHCRGAELMLMALSLTGFARSPERISTPVGVAFRSSSRRKPGSSAFACVKKHTAFRLAPE